MLSRVVVLSQTIIIISKPTIVGFLLRLIGSDLHYIHIVRLDLEPVFLVLRV